MANRSTGSGQWTNMGNVTPNPRGSYSDAETYKNIFVFLHNSQLV